MDVHLKRLTRCCQLALNANGTQKTNPLVGAMLVINDQIIAEGWHTGFGNPHAEVEVLNQVTVNNSYAEEYKSLYVSLEPCCHHGKTPPCTNLIINHGINEVHIGTLDPNPLVAGRGIDILEKSGIKVFLHHHQFSENINKPFNTILQYQRPYILLKWAQSADEFIGQAGEKIWLTNHGSKTFVHQLRNKADAIFVGNNTLRNDMPALNSRIPPFNNPKKIVFDKSCTLNKKWLNEWLSEGDFYFTGKNAGANLPLLPSGVNQIILKTCDTAYALEIWQELLSHLYQAHIGSILIEGGSEILQFLIDHDLWDELFIIKTAVKLGTGIKAPSFQSIPSSVKNIMEDQLEHYFNPSLYSENTMQSIYF
jgi:diaminohydroxyphosphoribosylaminopyrimidine deaminase / 5-amino-6-(5-phosphoribosylamino)uracil reductase